MARCVGLGFFFSGVESRSDLVCLKARSCIVGGMLANLSRIFKSTTTAASFSFTSLDGALGWCNGGKASFCPAGGGVYRHSTPSFLFFATVTLRALAFSASSLSMREREWWQKCLKSLNFDWLYLCVYMRVLERWKRHYYNNKVFYFLYYIV